MIYIKGKKLQIVDKSIITIGKFDGIHLGHQYLLKKTIECKNKKNENVEDNEIIEKKTNIKNIDEYRRYTSIVFTFETSDNTYGYIYNDEEKRKLIENCGIDMMISYPFDNEIKNMEAEIFIKDILCTTLGANIIVVGSDFRFGKDRRGDTDMLLRMSKKCGYEALICDKVKDNNNQEISSTIIKRKILESKLDEVKDMLGRNVSITGCVIDGKKLGRTIGIPTANLAIEKDRVTGKNGVYLSKITIDEDSYYGISNIGNKPTVGDYFDKGIETYIFNFDNNIYNKQIKVELLRYIRKEYKFESIDELKKQMSIDIDYAQSLI